MATAHITLHYIFPFAFQIKLGKMQRETTEMIQTREKEEQDLKQAINSFKVYLSIHRFCYEDLSCDI